MIWWILFVLLLVGIFLLSFYSLRYSFGKVEEGTTRVIMSLGQFDNIKMVWRGHFMDEDFNILREEEDDGRRRKKISGRIFGGFFFMGLYPFKKIHSYSITWSSSHGRKEGKAGISEEFKKINLKPEVYRSLVENAETKERVQCKVEYLVTLRINNPYRFLFVSPDNSLEEALSQIDTLIRDLVGSYSFEKLYTLERQKIWEKVKDRKLLRVSQQDPGTLQKWGIGVAKEGITFIEVSPMDKRITEALAEEQKEDFEAKGASKRIAKKVVYMMAEGAGKTPKQIARDIESDAETRNKFFSWCQEMVRKDLAMRSGSYINVDVESGGELEKTILNTIAGFLRMPQGPQGKGNEQGGVEKEEKKKPKNDVDADEDEIDEEEQENEESNKEEEGSEVSYSPELMKRNRERILKEQGR